MKNMYDRKIKFFIILLAFFELTGCMRREGEREPYPAPDPVNPTYGKLVIQVPQNERDTVVIKKANYKITGSFFDSHADLVYNNAHYIKGQRYLDWRLGDLTPKIETIRDWKLPDERQKVFSLPDQQGVYVLPRYPEGFELKTVDIDEAVRIFWVGLYEKTRRSSQSYTVIYPRLGVDHSGKCKDPILKLIPHRVSTRYYFVDKKDINNNYVYPEKVITNKMIEEAEKYLLTSPYTVITLDMSQLSVCLYPIKPTN
ncbi:hypothetical protein VQ643_08690 [Pseudomonas sp. F1_0610]|uniref:hypothetical protein n=1 Tax=Pseudomonas sp. F1_0610 TaxID=3114284 RepID=UPI0039C055D1